MLDYINACFGIFADFIASLFRLPLYGTLTIGYAVTGISVMGIVVVYFLGRIK